MKTYYGPIQAIDAAPSELDGCSAIVRHEFLIYPPSLIKRASSKRVVLCRRFSFASQVRMQFLIMNTTHSIWMSR